MESERIIRVVIISAGSGAAVVRCGHHAGGDVRNGFDRQSETRKIMYTSFCEGKIVLSSM
jgi:hypothetical protein